VPDYKVPVAAVDEKVEEKVEAGAGEKPAGEAAAATGVAPAPAATAPGDPAK
jgi:hypothetical protein